MEIDRQIEYDIRNYLSNLVDNTIDKDINKLLREEFKEFNKYELLCYSLIEIENAFKLDSTEVASVYEGGASIRIVLEWFIKILLKKYKINKRKFTYDQQKYGDFQKNIPIISFIYGNYVTNEQFKQMRGINKIKIEINDKEEYYFSNPIIENQVDSCDNYFFGKYTSSEDIKIEKEKKRAAATAIFKKYFLGSYRTEAPDFFDFKKIDSEIYYLCKENIRVDIDKIGCEFNSNIFKNKETIINILGAFIYISHVIVIRNDLKSVIPGKVILFEQPVITSKTALMNLLKKFFTISEDELSKIIDYFSISNDSKLGINEHPLININDYILWIPSSFIMNDFQFSIVNGHYSKGIKIINHKETVAESVVDKINSACRNCKNIVVATDKEYYDANNSFNNKVLRGEIDVALYDIYTNSLLIIECKWEDKLFVRGDKYKLICDEINKIYRKQLEKDKYFLNLDINNLDVIFDNDTRVKSRLYYPSNVLYIVVDKRIQLHYDNKHALSEFNFLKIIKDNSVNGVLRLDNVISYIKSLKTEVKYTVKETKSTINYKDKKINNSLFTILAKNLGGK